MPRQRLPDTVPIEITDGLLAFCASISAEPPQFVPSRPIFRAKQSACFDNVARAIARKGGDVVPGWAIWHFRGAYFEAEHHGVWRRPAGDLVDISPQINRSPKILFLPDLDAPYDPLSFRSNVIRPEPGSALGEQIVSLAARRNEILDGYRAGGKREVEISHEHAIELEMLNQQIPALLRLIER